MKKLTIFSKNYLEEYIAREVARPKGLLPYIEFKLYRPVISDSKSIMLSAKENVFYSFYRTPIAESTDHFLWRMLKKSDCDLACYALNIPDFGKDYSYLYEVYWISGESVGSYLYRLASALSKLDFWKSYTRELSDWLDFHENIKEKKWHKQKQKIN